MRRIYSVLTLVMIFAFTGTANASDMFLQKDTALIPQGWSVADDDLKFKKNTTAILNDNGELISGTLNSDTYLRPVGWKNIVNDFYFAETGSLFFPRFFHPIHTYDNVALSAYGHIRYKADAPVIFNAEGLVIKGTIDEDVTVALQNNKYGFVTFKEGTILTFDDKGAVISATLEKDTKLRPVGWKNNLNTTAGFIEFKSGTPITFTSDGYVTAGTVKKAVSWKKTDGTITEISKNTAVQFTS